MDCLSSNNQQWANSVPLFIITTSEKSNEYGENRFASYDLGSAVTSITFQATFQGLKVRQIGGYDRDQLCKEFAIPENYFSGAVLAVGYLGGFSKLSKDLLKREKGP